MHMSVPHKCILNGTRTHQSSVGLLIYKNKQWRMVSGLPWLCRTRLENPLWLSHDKDQVRPEIALSAESGEVCKQQDIRVILVMSPETAC
jgi:hypothetical protein